MPTQQWCPPPRGAASDSKKSLGLHLVLMRQAHAAKMLGRGCREGPMRQLVKAVGLSATRKKVVGQWESERAARRAGQTSCRVQGRGLIALASHNTPQNQSPQISGHVPTQAHGFISYHSPLPPAIPRCAQLQREFLFRLSLRRRNEVSFILACNKGGSISPFFELLSARASVLKYSSLQTCILICVCHCYF